ncbi:hypothetical protein Dxin01_03904 [Deinococcus xinjiangensis]|uniref:Antitoxin VbhA domain-containing protein n=1 Tax=Deinococcus xinjiangensis TaxID=457454 RepID=A0ABP9VFY0_9DEIO
MTTLQDHLQAEAQAAIQKRDQRKKRLAIVKAVAHSSAMEGMPLSHEMKGMLNACANGEMTTAQVRAKLDAKYRR